MGNFVTASPNEAVLISGLGGTSVKVGSTGWRFWIVNRVERLSLELIQLELNSIGAETVQGVRVDVTAVANVKVKARLEQDADNPDTAPKLDRRKIQQAAQQFGGKKAGEIHDLLKQALEGHQRQILGTLTVEQVFKDRASFSNKVREHVYDDLDRMGFEVVSYSIKAITDQNEYMTSLGATQTAMVKREAQEGRAKNESEAQQKVSQAESVARIVAAKAAREAHVAANEQKEQEVESDQILELRKAEIQRSVGEAREKAEAAISIVKAEQEQEVVRQKTHQRFIQKEVETEIAQQEAQRAIVEAEGEAKARLVAQENDAKAVIVKAEAEAKKQRLLAQAEADAIRAKGEAEAANIRLKAEAYNTFGQAALAHMLIEKMPEIAAEVAKPLAQTDKITFVSNGGEGGGGGPSALTKDVTNILSGLPNSIHALTGFDLREAIQNAPVAGTSSGGKRSSKKSASNALTAAPERGPDEEVI